MFSPIVGRIVGKVDPRILISFGIGWMATMMLWRAGFTSQTPFSALIIPQFLQGLGIPFFFIPLMGLGTGSLPANEVASGAGLISFVRSTAGAFAVSITTTAWEDSSDTERVNLLNQSGGLPDAVNALGGLGMSTDQALRQVEGLVQSQAVMLATDRLFLIIAILLFVAGALAWIARPPKGPIRMPAGGH